MLTLQVEALDFVHKFLDVTKLTVDRGEADVGDFVESAEMLHDFVANGLGRNFIAVCFHQLIDHFVHCPLNCFPADRPLFAGFIDTCDQLFAIKRLIPPIPLQNPKIVPLNFLVGREAMFAGEALPSSTDYRLIFNSTRIDHLIITSLTFWATASTCGGVRRMFITTAGGVKRLKPVNFFSGPGEELSCLIR